MNSCLQSANCFGDCFTSLFKDCETHCKAPSVGCMDSCKCCANLKPRYKRKVDSIFPVNAEDGIVKSNMEKLSYYAESSPEKLDRIGEYLAARVALDMPRANRVGNILIAVEAMDALLIAAVRAQSLNLFIEAYLKVVQLLLESEQPNMQLLATRSFTKFGNIDEDTPSDFFVSKFSALCHDNNDDHETRRMLRVAGLNGLKGVIRKTVSDDLQTNIWDKDHMGKIIPSLLYNMQDNTIMYDMVDEHGCEVVAPNSVAEDNFRELICKASFSNIRSVLRPLLGHLDHHGLWDAEQSDQESNFAMDLFNLIMNTIQPQHSYAVIQLLMQHLDSKELKSRPKFHDHEAITKLRTGIATVLANIVAIAASESIGPTVLEIINSLLNHLRTSINFSVKLNAINAERKFQDTIINALGEFANNLPDFQKIEIMMFIISKVPPTSASSEADVQLQAILLKSLLKVATTYRTVNMAQAFPTPFLKPLLIMSAAPDPNVRLVVQKIFQQLLDRHANLTKLQKPTTMTSIPHLTVEKAYRQDLMFMKKHGGEILQRLYEGFKMANNTGDNYDALYTTLALFCIELSSDEVLVEILRVALCLQDAASTTSTLALALTEQQKTAMHSISASLCYLCAHLSSIAAIIEHVNQVILTRQKSAPWLIPESNRYSTPSRRRPSLAAIAETPDELKFDKAIIEEALRTAGHDTSSLFTAFTSTNGNEPTVPSRSQMDLNQISVDIDSVASSPGAQHRRYIDEEVTFASMKKMLTQPIAIELEQREQRRAQLLLAYRTQPFDELCARTEQNQAGSGDLKSTAAEIFSKFHNAQKQGRNELTIRVSADCNIDTIDKDLKEDEMNKFLKTSNLNITENPFGQLITFDARRPPLFAMRFPDLFVCS